MRADDAIEVRKLWSRMSYAPALPAATVIAERDWTAYVQAMAEAVPTDEDAHFPNEADVLWAWPDGVAVVFSEPFDVAHTIISHSVEGLMLPEDVEPHTEMQLVSGFIVGATHLIATREPGATEFSGQVSARPILWIGADPHDIISGHWLPGSVMRRNITGKMSQSTRLQLAIITALGHRLTRVEQVAGGRGERRRAERELPGLRVLQLATGASVSRSEGLGTVEWSKRWMVRGHWHTVAYGPKRSLRKLKWYDPYVKGPADKPLDVRPTVWRAHSHTEGS